MVTMTTYLWENKAMCLPWTQRCLPHATALCQGRLAPHGLTLDCEQGTRIFGHASSGQYATTSSTRRGMVFSFFVHENVPGLDTYGSADRRETPAMRIITYLQDELGSGWGIDKTVMNTSDFGLPQRRKRLYIIGRRMTSYPLGCPSPCPVFKQPGHSCDICLSGCSHPSSWQISMNSSACTGRS